MKKCPQHLTHFINSVVCYDLCLHFQRLNFLLRMPLAGTDTKTDVFHPLSSSEALQADLRPANRKLSSFSRFTFSYFKLIFFWRKLSLLIDEMRLSMSWLTRVKTPFVTERESMESFIQTFIRLILIYYYKLRERF